MRKNILAAGSIMLVLALLFALSYPLGLFFTLPISVLNIVIGLVTKVSPGLQFQPDSDNIRLVVDRGVVRASVYQIAFLKSKLVLKRLSSVSVTVILALVLAIVGYEFLFVVGALMGGVTGFSLQEFLTQRMRNKISDEKDLTTIGQSDIEFEYANLVEARLLRNRLYLITDSRSLAISFPRGYSRRLEPMLNEVLGSTLTTEESIRAAQAAEKQQEKSEHTSSDRGKLSGR
jgi:hypothetical protein